MAEIITAKGTGFYIEKVIRGAREKIVLISPYLKVQKLYLDELKAAANKGIEISVLFREEESRREQVDALLSIKGIRLFHLPELHAKCYFNEHRFVLTSMNLHDHSERNNKELGIMLEQDRDAALFNEALDSAMAILAIAHPMRSTRVEDRRAGAPAQAKVYYRESPAKDHELPVQGFCIRCKDQIPCNPDAPLCYDDFTTWVRYEDPEFVEKYCHTCGRSAFVCMADPMCNSCNHNYSSALKKIAAQRMQLGDFAKKSWRKTMR